VKINKILNEIKEILKNDNSLTVGTDSFGHCHIQKWHGDTFTSIRDFWLGDSYTIFEIDGKFYCVNNRTERSKIFLRRD